MEEIKEGEYVRLLRNQGINKIIEIEYDGFLILDDIIVDEWGEPIDRISPEDIDKEILKHSFNIIDLIEVGDIVDYESGNAGIRVKKEVYYVCTEKEDYKWGEGYIYTLEDEFVKKEHIYSIVTKEQFESIEYKVGD